MRRLVVMIVVLAAGAMLALPHGAGVASPVGRLQGIRAMFECEASGLQQIAHNPAAAAVNLPRCLPR